MKAIPLNHGYVAFVDDEDFNELSRFKWHAEVRPSGICYAVRNGKTRTDGKLQGFTRMHRQILKLKNPKILTDHHDGNGLNNQRSNLRVVTPTQNARNMKIGLRNTSGFKGVSLHGKKWRAYINVAERFVSLGSYVDPREAAQAYDFAAHKFYGPYAKTNQQMGLL